MPVFCGLLAVQFAIQPFLTRTFTEGLDAGAFVAAVEVLKLAICLVFFRLRASGKQIAWNWRSCLRAAGPAILYVLANMAMTVANKCLDAVTCNVISQTKLLFTAFFALQPLSARKWVGISVILLASLVTALDSEGQEAQAYFRGTVAAFTAASFSAVAAVLAERALDGRDPLVYTAELSLFGLIFLLCIEPKCFLQLRSARPSAALPLTTQALGGIFVGVVTKRFGSLNKSILLVVSLLMTGVLHVFLEGSWPSLSAIASICLVVTGLVIYKDLASQLHSRWHTPLGCGDRRLLGGPLDAWVKEYSHGGVP